MPTLYLTGYAGETVPKGTKKGEALLSLVHELDLLLCDIRFSPNSPARLWRKANMAEMFGDRYLHLRELGNRNYNTGLPIQIDDYEAGTRKLLDACQRTGLSPLLVCGCPVLQYCHRCTVANALVKDGHFENAAELPRWDKTREEIEADIAQRNGLVTISRDLLADLSIKGGC